MSCVQLLLGAALTAAAPSAVTAGEGRVDFARDIRPILSENCFQCHGPDDGQREADLRLDLKADALGDRGGYVLFAPGKPVESEAYRRLTAEDASERMPPPDSGKQLSPAQLEQIRRWIEQGAEWSEHWAFVPPVRPAVPSLHELARTPIDAFILQRLRQEGLTLSPPAGQATLLRRLCLDLIGLPPTIDEIDDFLADDGPAAYEKQVDRLLASPHYGERWGRHWLDAARYADSDGYEKDKPRRVWLYRDWVIGALNRDLPYDEFVVQQIAGDLLESVEDPASRVQGQNRLVATGFLRNSMINEEGGIDPEQFRMEAMFDRMDALGKAVLGLTIQCAQCHNHKYDPLTQREYYGLFAFLNNSHEGSLAAYTPDEQMLRADLFRRIAEIEAGLKHRHPDWPERLAAWEDEFRSGVRPTWQIVRPELDASGGQKHNLLEDRSVLAQGYAPTKHTTEFTVTTDQPRITAVRLELLNDPNLPLGGPGRSIFGLCALTEFRVAAAPVDRPGRQQEAKIASATANVNPAETPLDAAFADKTDRRRVTGPIAYALDGKDETAWGIDIGPGRSNVPREAVFVFEKPIAFAGGSVLTFKLTQNHGGWNSDDNQNNNLGRFRFWITDGGAPTADPVPPRVREILESSPEERTPAQRDALFRHWRTTVPEWAEANGEIEELWRRHPAGSAQLVLNERERPRATHLLARGDFLKPEDPIEPGVPGFLHSLPADAPRNRLTLARWLVDGDSPTTARAFVNRVWQAYFGTGIFATSEDLGSQSALPTHPELLDWLAVEFNGNVERGARSADRKASPYNIPHSAFRVPRSLSLKHLHRLIVTSAAYRQSSQVTPELLSRDPDNRLLGRGPRARVEAEVVRDIALAASGLLDRTFGGPSVYPPAPEFLFEPPASYGPKVWQEDSGRDRYRRAVYTFRYRSVPYPVLETFDAPNGDFSCVRRTRSNTPLQALVTLNEPLFFECAQALARRIIEEGGTTDRQRLDYGFRLCLGRSPREEEAAVLTGLLRQQSERLADRNASALELLGGNADRPADAHDAPDKTARAKLAAWTAAARVLLNLDETISKE